MIGAALLVGIAGFAWLIRGNAFPAYDIAALLLVVVTTAKCLEAAARAPLLRVRRGWHAFALGTVCWGLGVIGYAWTEHTGVALYQDPMPLDVMFALNPICVAVGVYFYRAQSISEAVSLRRIGDFAVILVTLTVILVLMVYRPDQPEATIARLASSASYAVLTLATLVYTVLSFRHFAVGRTSSRVFTLIIVAAGCQAAAGAGLCGLILMGGSWATQAMLDGLWTLHLLAFLAAAMFELRRTEYVERVEVRTMEVDVLTTVLAVCCLGAALTVVPVSWSSPQIVGIGFGLIALALALGVRYQGVALVEKELKDRLLELNAELEARVAHRTEELQSALDAAEFANGAKSRFLANMSHELRTPLSGILGYTALVGDELLDMEDVLRAADAGSPATLQIRADVQNIEVAGAQLLALINQVLDIARVEAGHVALNSRSVDLRDVIAEASAVAELRLGNTAFSVQIAEDVPAIHTDPGRVHQVLVNLIKNAIELGEQGTVLVRVIRDGEHVEIVVEDSGPGISEEDLVRVFESPPSPHAPGVPRAGLGMSLGISRALATLLGGVLVARSTVGVGTTFVLRLPIAPGTTPGLSARA